MLVVSEAKGRHGRECGTDGGGLRSRPRRILCRVGSLPGIVRTKLGQQGRELFKRRISVDVGWPETVGEWLELIKKPGENVSWGYGLHF
jgi:hypothetical protein